MSCSTSVCIRRLRASCSVPSRLDPRRFLVNPPGLNRAIKQALWFPSDETRAQAREAVAKAREEAGDRTLLVSEPAISGDMYSSHEDWHRNLEFVHELFPQARIIYFVRRQSDWLHSAYRQSLVKGPGVPIGFFLNFRNGEFRTRTARMIGRARNLNALKLRFVDIYLGYAKTFGPRLSFPSGRPETIFRVRIFAACAGPGPGRYSGTPAKSQFQSGIFRAGDIDLFPGDSSSS